MRWRWEGISPRYVFRRKCHPFVGKPNGCHEQARARAFVNLKGGGFIDLRVEYFDPTFPIGMLLSGKTDRF